MFSNYFISALRNLIKGKLNSVINILGLAIGFAAVMLISLFVINEHNFDGYFKNADRIHLVVQAYDLPDGRRINGGSTSGTFLAPLKESFPEIEAGSRFSGYQRIISDPDTGRRFFENIDHADPDFLKIFDLEFVAGGGIDALSDQSKMIINEDIAIKYFGNTDVIGKTLSVDNNRVHTVSGVFKNPPSNTSLAETNVILPIIEDDMAAWPKLIRNPGANQWRTFVLLPEGASGDVWKDRLFAHVRDKVPSLFPGAESATDYLSFLMVPLSDLHFFSSDPAQISPELETVNSFTLIAFVVLIIAGLNFVNLSIARSGGRALEVAMRKVLGAGRRSIIIQYLTESVMIALLALVIGFVFLEIGLPFFNQVMDLELTFDFGTHLGFILSAFFFAVAIGVLGGMYPAFIVSNFRPGLVLKANKSSGKTSPWLRQILVVAQFVASITLIAVTVIVYQQTSFAQSADLGYARDGQLVLSGMDHPGLDGKEQLLRDRLAQVPGVMAAANSLNVPGEGIANNNGFTYESEGKKLEFLAYSFGADPEFLQTYGVELLAGRLPQRGRVSDDWVPVRDSVRSETTENLTLNVLVDERMVERLGYTRPEDILGKQARFGGVDRINIVGVVKNMNFKSARTAEVNPLVMFYRSTGGQRMTIRFETSNINQIVGAVERVWSEIAPNVPIQRTFFDDRLNRLYEGDISRGRLFLVFAVFAIFIASLGLYGLASITAAERTKEIGIRKVMGAGRLDVVKLMLWQFSKPVLVANVTSWPLAWYLSDSWLSGFAQRIDLTPTPFLMASLTGLVVAWFTVASHAWRVSGVNPIYSLKAE